MRRVAVFVAGVMMLNTAGVMLGGEKSEPLLDKDFLIKVANANKAEIEISKLADKRAESTQVRDYANMLVKDHKDALEQLSKLLETRKLAIVAGLNKEQQEEVSRLRKLEGNSFDRAFLQCMIKDHTNAIATFEAQAKNGREEDVRNYAKESLPTLRKHLSKAKDLARSVEK